MSKSFNSFVLFLEYLVDKMCPKMVNILLKLPHEKHSLKSLHGQFELCMTNISQVISTKPFPGDSKIVNVISFNSCLKSKYNAL